MDKNQRKCFFISMLSTFYALALLTGLTIVEKNARNTMFEESSPFLVYEHKNRIPKLLKIHFMGRDFVFNF